MLEFSLSVRVPFWLVGASGMPRRCAVTLPLFWEKDIPCSASFLSSWRRQCRGRARSDRNLSWLIGVKRVHWRNIPNESSGLIVGKGSGIVRCCVRCLPAFNGTHIHLGRHNWRWEDGSGDWGLYFSFPRITARVANTLNGLGGKLRSLRLGGTIGCWLPNPYGIAGSLGTESNVTICGSSEATEEIAIVSLAIAPDNCFELKRAGRLFRAGLPSSAERSKKSHPILRMKNPTKEVGSSQWLKTTKFERYYELLKLMNILEEVMM